MSLDISIMREGVYQQGSRGITHNCAKHAKALGVYDILWRPKDNRGTKVSEALPLINKAIVELNSNLDEYKQYDAENGWGCAESFLEFLRDVREYCEDAPDGWLEASI
ncbi:hypothetical protein FWH13_03025 [Candidatus Saccharibacteria bacterium]|nr:hypothetical protein [Candidatus Saccharibacteria bacterium]